MTCLIAAFDPRTDFHYPLVRESDESLVSTDSVNLCRKLTVWLEPRKNSSKVSLLFYLKFEMRRTLG